MKSKLQLCTAFMAMLMVMGLARGIAQTPIGQTDTPPTIDGTKDASWDVAPAYLVVDPSSWSPSAAIMSDEDFSLTWSAIWDDTNLYFFFEFMDDVVTTGELDSMANKDWMNDNVEVGIGPYGYRFAWNRDDEILGTNQGNPGGYMQKSVEVSGGYVIEVSIPWTTLVNDTINIGENPAIGTTLTVSVVGGDLDNPDGWNWNELEGHLNWSAAEVILAATAAIDDVAPAAPANLTASNVNFAGAELSWDASADEDVIGYMLYNGTAPFSYVVGATELTAALAAEASFAFTVKAIDSQNRSGASNQADVSTPAPPVPMVQNIGKYTGTYPNPFEDFDAWDALPKLGIGRQATPDVDPADHSASFSAMWDETNLYVKTYVHDDIFYNASETEGWKNDAVEYHFDMNNERNGSSTDSQLPPYEADNFQYRAVYKKPELQTGSTPAPDWTGVTMVTWDLQNASFEVVGYYIEATFPWATLNIPGSTSITPAVDVAIGFDINSGDTDDNPNARKSVVWSSVEFSPHANTSQYGQLVLKDNVVSVEKMDKAQVVSVYPNPTTRDLHVELPDAQMELLQIKDILGRTVYSQEIEGRTGTMRIDLSGLPQGVYVLTVDGKGETMGLSKFIKK